MNFKVKEWFETVPASREKPVVIVVDNNVRDPRLLVGVIHALRVHPVQKR